MISLRNSLFLKIFLWFGSAMLTMIVITFLVGEFIRDEPFRPHRHNPPDVSLAAYAKTAVDTFKREGQSGLATYLEQVRRGTRLRPFLFGSDLNELTGRQPRREIVDLARNVLQTDERKTLKNDSSGLLGQRVQGEGGEQYVWIVELPPQPPLLVRDHFLHLLAMASIGAVFCYWLARHLTAPVTQLRRATNELAGGNLAARVGPSLGKRRDELASLGSDFDQMAEQIELLLKAQRRLLGDISHELRSPLARLNVALELARQRAGPDATTALQRIRREAENLNVMIGQLLALTRLETGTREINKHRFDLAKLVQEIADDADFEARSRNRSVRLNSSESCIVSGNEELLRPAIENVVRNAIHYTAEKSEVQIDICKGGPAWPSQAGSQEGSKNGFAEVTVRDHGAGVPENALVDIFRPFYRVDDSRDRESGGTGLGLAITERAVRLHGGTVTARNAPDSGLIITINLPCAPA